MRSRQLNPFFIVRATRSKPSPRPRAAPGLRASPPIFNRPTYFLISPIILSLLLQTQRRGNSATHASNHHPRPKREKTRMGRHHRPGTHLSLGLRPRPAHQISMDATTERTFTAPGWTTTTRLGGDAHRFQEGYRWLHAVTCTQRSLHRGPSVGVFRSMAGVLPVVLGFRRKGKCGLAAGYPLRSNELELTQTHTAQKPALRVEVGARALRVRSVSRDGAWASAGVQGAWVSGCGFGANSS